MAAPEEGKLEIGDLWERSLSLAVDQEGKDLCVNMILKPVRWMRALMLSIWCKVEDLWADMD